MINEHNMTATSVRTMQDLKFNRARDIAGKFLNESNALDLHVSLTHFLVEIDDTHQKEISELKSIIEAMVLAANK